MKKIVLITVGCLAFFCCNGQTRLNANAEKTDTSTKTVAKPTVKAHEESENTDSCYEKFRKLIVYCPYFRTELEGIDRDSLNVDCDQVEGDSLYVVRIYWGDNYHPLHWVEVNVNARTLKDVTYDPEEPVTLHYDKKLYDEVMSCYGIKPNRELMQTGNDSIYDEDYPTKLPYDELAFDIAYEKFYNQEIEEEDLPAHLCAFNDNLVLKRIYVNKYNDKSVNSYMIVPNPTDISVFILYPNPQRIITYKNNHIIDRLKLPYNKADPQGNEITFTISKDYIITVYRNKFTKKGKMIEHKPSAKYKINEDGTFVKID